MAENKVAELLADYPVVVEQKVVWGDMDSYQHVNNVVYFRYFENARVAYFDRLDWTPFEKDTGIGPILAATQARFRRALTFPDTISIAARLSNLAEDRFTLEHIIVSHGQQAIVTRGDGEIVSFHYRAQRKVPIPEELRRRIVELEKRQLKVGKELV